MRNSKFDANVTLLRLAHHTARTVPAVNQSEGTGAQGRTCGREQSTGFTRNGRGQMNESARFVREVQCLHAFPELASH